MNKLDAIGLWLHNKWSKSILHEGLLDLGNDYLMIEPMKVEIDHASLSMQWSEAIGVGWRYPEN